MKQTSLYKFFYSHDKLKKEKNDKNTQIEAFYKGK